MYTYITEEKAIIGLHEKGFSEDFQIRGNDLLWVREQAIVRTGAFSIIECHSICNAGKNQPEKILFGIYLPSENVRGILIRRFGRYVNKVPPVIRKKLGELMEHIRWSDPGCGRKEAKMWVNLSGNLQTVEEIKNLRFWNDELIWSHLN